MSTIDLIIEEQDHLKANSYTFHLLTREWKKFNLPDSLNWQIHPFQEDQKALIPSNSGVYSFVIQPDIASHPYCSYRMYVGIAQGNPDYPGRTLRRRFSDYLYEQNNPSGRPKILRLL